MKARHVTFTSALLSLALAVSVSAKPAPPVMPAELMAMIKQSGGVFTPQIRAEFLRNAESLVMQELAGVKVALTAEQIAFIRNDPVLADACYGTVYPPDPRILLNLLELRATLGDEFFGEYRNLIVAGAVARRFVGVGEAALGEKEEWALRSRAEAQEKTGVRRWPEYSVVKIAAPASAAENDDAKNKKSPPARVVKKRQEKTENRQSKKAGEDGMEIVFDFLQERKLTPAALMESAPLKAELLKRMGKHAPASGTITYQMLMDVMAEKGLRPAERDPFPSMAEFCRYLDEIKPRFPIKTAPWPVMMPLAKGWPLREARAIWSNYEKSGKLPTYGKYQGKEKVIQARLEPFPWHWNSWQGTYQAGGVCHEMSTIGLGAYMSVGVPTCKAGQPHHSCILVFSHSENGWFVGTKQGTKGPTATHSQWLFAEPKVEILEPYHIGLALSMNVGLSQYISSRMGVHLAEMLATKNEHALAEAMLKSVARINPFNTEVWAALRGLRSPGKNPALHKAELVQLLAALIPTGDGDVIIYKDKPTDVSLENEKEEDHSGANPKKWAGTYVNVLCKSMLLSGVEPVADRETNKKILAALQASAGGSIPVGDLITAFRVTIDGWESFKEPVLNAARLYAAQGGKELAEATADKIRAAAKEAGHSRALIAWLRELEKICEQDMTIRNRPRSKNVYGDPLYRVINDELVRQLNATGQKAEAAALARKLETEIEEEKKKKRK
jgi:hypothetical protein